NAIRWRSNAFIFLCLNSQLLPLSIAQPFIFAEDSTRHAKPVSLRALRTIKVNAMTQTFIPGKDAALEDSIARF
ncbi:hypothetical protein JVW24_24800, partial [Vibrio cholerae O1]|nr:hypothetical protein [Vibrio cholerae O1]